MFILSHAPFKNIHACHNNPYIHMQIAPPLLHAFIHSVSIWSIFKIMNIVVFIFYPIPNNCHTLCPIPLQLQDQVQVKVKGSLQATSTRQLLPGMYFQTKTIKKKKQFKLTFAWLKCLAQWFMKY